MLLVIYLEMKPRANELVDGLYGFNVLCKQKTGDH